MTSRTKAASAAAPRASTRRDTVAFVSQARGIGGSTRSLANILERLEPGVNRVLVAPKEGKFLDLVQARALAEERVFIPMPGGPQSWRLSRLPAALNLAFWAWRNRGRLAAIHANGPAEMNLAAPAALISGRPLVVWIHAYEVSPWTRRFGPFWRRLLSGHDVRWTAVSSTAGAVLTGSGLARADDIEIVPNPIDPDEVVGARPAPQKTVRIAYVGSAEGRKGFRILPEVIEGLADLDVKWLLFTNENSRDAHDLRATWARLNAFPKDRVERPGKIQDITAVYGSCDLVFCPSLKESFCRVAAEAMLNGVPVVASDLVPLRELLGDDEAGLLFEPNNALEAIGALRTLTSDETLRNSLGVEGRRRARAFDPAAIASRLATLYGVGAAEDPL